MKNLLSIFTVFILFTGCVGDWDRKLDEKKIATQFSENSTYFSTKSVRLQIKEYKKILSITLDYKTPKNFSFPVDSFYGDTLTETRFYLKINSNGMPVKLDKSFSGYFGTINDPEEIIIPFKKQTIYSSYHDQIQIPLNVFHALKKGKQNLEGELYINAFYGSHFDTISNETIPLEIPYHQIHGKIKFILDIPEIYRTDLYGYGLELRNDEGFSPSGMDFSFRQGYPDIYWQIYYPAYGEKDFSFPYWRSAEATYSTEYQYLDTISLYHFSTQDELKIGVYDRDDMSRDDFLGDWFGSLSELVTNDSAKILKFDNLKWFKIKAVQKGCINK